MLKLYIQFRGFLSPLVASQESHVDPQSRLKWWRKTLSRLKHVSAKIQQCRCTGTKETGIWMAHARRGADIYAVRISIIQPQLMCGLSLMYVKNNTDIFSSSCDNTAFYTWISSLFPVIIMINAGREHERTTCNKSPSLTTRHPATVINLGCVALCKEYKKNLINPTVTK